jgi:DNA-binding transcriptional LysR family regulator
MVDPPPDLETAELRSFVALAEQRHFGRAAEVLGVSQPALSKRVQRLEEKVGGPLFLRGYRDVRPTEAGRLLLERARVVLREAGLALSVSRQALRGEAGLLRIGFGVASMARLLPATLLRFRRQHPRVEIHMRDMATHDQLQALRDGEIDLGFVRMPVVESDFECVPILHERLAAAVSQHAAWKERIGLSSLAGQPFVVCSRTVSASYYDHVMALCRAAGFAPRIVTETNELFSLLQLVRAGIGVALVPSSAAAMKVPGVRFKLVQLQEANPWDIGLVRRRPPQPGALVDAFVRVALEVYAETGKTRVRAR